MVKTRHFIVLSVTFLSFSLSSCAPKLPQYKNTPTVESFTIPSNFPASSSLNAKDLVKENWKLFFQDDNLIALIETALANNQELNILDQEISIVSNEVMARKGQYLPKVGVGVDYGYDKKSEYSSQGVSDEANGLSDKLHTREMSLNATWEVDIWGKLRNFSKAASLEYLASIEGRNFAATQLVAETAIDYYELMALDNELEIVEQFIKTLKDAQQVVQLQQIAGRTTSLAVRRFDAEVSKNESRKYQIEQQIVVTENHLNKILGRLPQKIERQSSKFKNMNLAEVVAGIPTDLLDNRPDLKQASLRIEAAKLNTKAVKAQFYPSLNIDGNIGYQSFNSRHFVDPASLVYNVAGGLTAPLLNRQAIKADYFSANNRQIEAVFNYEKTFINAFVEVTNQLAAVKNYDQIYQAKAKQTEALSDSFEISNLLFKAARVDYLESLLTRRDYLESQLDLIEVKQKQLSSYVNLYRALGGGWRGEKVEVGK